MLRFFRQIRQRLLTSNRLSKYLLYAIGEILLVVIGILIALQVDNWNEERKTEAEIRAVFARVLTELENNIEESEKIFRYYEVEDSLAYMLSLGQLGKDDIRVDYPSDVHPALRLNAVLYHELSLVQSSYNQLINNIDNVPDYYLSIVDELVDLYETKKEAILFQQNRLIRSQARNEERIKDLSFFVHRFDTLMTSNESFLDYVLYDDAFKGEYILHQQLYQEKLEEVGLFREKAISCHQQISIMLGISDKKAVWAIDPEMHKFYEGTFMTFNGVGSRTFFIKDNMLYSDTDWLGNKTDEILIHPGGSQKFYDRNWYFRFEKDEDSIHIFAHRFGRDMIGTKILD
ncbi:DUF6090 family protein [Robiginitalea sp. IMCC44478]|uniref:DUF6090 family protein n=1 Tax=Robiginitalea sp. IMCC44478 TaxID=3459122 RepID=UPI0040429D45